MNNFKLGDRVVVNSTHKGRAVSVPGTVVEVVPANTYPKDKKSPGYRGFNHGKQSAKRDHESYVIEPDRGDRIWPRVLAIAYESAPVSVATTTAHPPGTIITTTSETKPDGSVVTTTVISTPPVATVSDLENDFVILLDSSGSMGSVRDATIRAFNNEVEAIKIEAGKAGMREPKISLWTFGDRGLIKNVFHRQPVTALRPIDQSTYRPDGGTPMFECIEGAIDQMMREHDVRTKESLSVVMHVITDGEATDYGRIASVKRAIESTRATGRWTHVLMVPKGSYRQNFQQKYPGLIHDNNILEWETTAAGMAQASAATTNAVGSYMIARSTGSKSVSNFFQPDLSKLTAADLAKLTDLSAHFKLYDVQHEASVKDFIEGHTKSTYIIGSAYYQLMKTEKEVQNYKGILLRDKATGRVFGGIEARKVIGLPLDRTVKVEPGNHSNFDIFIESASVNRILPRGTKVMHDFTQRVDKQPTWDHTSRSNGVSAHP